MTVTIDQDLKDILTKLDQRFDRIDQKLDTIQKDVVDLKVSITELRGELKALTFSRRLKARENVNIM